MALVLLAPAAPSLALDPTPAQVRGPFHPYAAPVERDSDLAQVAGRSAQGMPLEVRGRVATRAGEAVAGARVELWQANAHGRYHHPKDDDSSGPLDPGFQGWGETRTGAQGEYSFRTIMPVAYGGRTPHLHFIVHAPGRPEFVTQLYLAGNAANAGDFLYARLSAAERARITVAVEGGVARFDIVLP
ncbi:MAG: intradiol ring-cleavage dioxygenase [Rhodocyclaceae bacterium]|nr:intradiol ring-cleavage dioxygenase [Rhodocyclaceae bacterium]